MGGGRFNYSGRQGEIYHAQRRLPGAAERWISGIRAAKIQTEISPTDSVFEYGVGFGWNLALLNCRSKAGFDLAGQLDQEVEKKGIVFIRELGEGTESFEVVLCHHTLEHVPAPAQTLQQIKTLLKPGGKLLLFVPLEREKKYRRMRASDRAHHLFSWTPAALQNLAAANGYKIISNRIQLFRFDRAAAVLAHRFKLGELGYRFLRKAGQFLLPEYEIALVAQKIAR